MGVKVAQLATNVNRADVDYLRNLQLFRKTKTRRFRPGSWGREAVSSVVSAGRAGALREAEFEHLLDAIDLLFLPVGKEAR